MSLRKGPSRPALAAPLLGLAASPAISNFALFRQEIQGTTDLTRNLPMRMGAWNAIREGRS